MDLQGHRKKEVNPCSTGPHKLEWAMPSQQSRENGRAAPLLLTDRGSSTEQGVQIMKHWGERGQGFIKYTLILALVAMIVLMILVMFGPQIIGPVLRK